ncbi:MAG: helix-turn-helix transcriptional regulator [Thermoguttaceae bacterium]
MIATALVEEIRHMLREGRLSQREIAKRLGVSRGTVNAIASGRRREQVRRPEQAEDDGFIPPTGLPKRCPGCGGLAQMPCLACYIRAKNEARRAQRPIPGRRPTRGSTAIASCG